MAHRTAREGPGNDMMLETLHHRYHGLIRTEPVHSSPSSPYILTERITVVASGEVKR